MIPFTYKEPASVEEALELLALHGEEAKLIAGGTGLINLMKLNLVQPEMVIGLKALGHLSGIVENGGLRIGALTTLHTLETSAVLARAAPLLADACRHVATVRVRVAATLGGAMAHADPHMDTPPALIALDARIVARSKRGQREIAVEDLFTGYFETVLEPDELVTEVIIPPQPAGNGTAFLKFLPASHDDYATISVACRLVLDAAGRIANARIALGSAGLTPVRARMLEGELVGLVPGEKAFDKAMPLVADQITPLADFRGSSEYKRSMAVVFVRRALLQASGAAKAAI